MIDRKRLFGEMRHLFGRLSQAQVDGTNVIVDAWEEKHSTRDSGTGDIRQLAYILATAWHETATRMEPVMETRRANEATNPSVDTAIKRLESSWKAGKLKWVKSPYWRKDSNGRSWLGRGPVQCTHWENYFKCEKALGIPFTKDPELMLQAHPAAQAMVFMMETGGYTGKKLADYFTAIKADAKGARQIVNDHDRDTLIASYWTSFLHALTPLPEPIGRLN